MGLSTHRDSPIGNLQRRFLAATSGPKIEKDYLLLVLHVH
jgi:hypothetical protein